MEATRQKQSSSQTGSSLVVWATTEGINISVSTLPLWWIFIKCQPGILNARGIVLPSITESKLPYTYIYDKITAGGAISATFYGSWRIDSSCSFVDAANLPRDYK